MIPGRAALSLCGSYAVGNEPMDSWLNSNLPDITAGATTLADVASELGQRLTDQCDPNQTSMFHVAGFETEAGRCRPEMWYVRNVDGIRQDGSYGDRLPRFKVSEDFWGRDYPMLKASGAVNSSGEFPSWMYFNGHPHGRQIFHPLTLGLRGFFENAVWANPDWKFRQPQTIHEEAELLATTIRMIGGLYGASEYGAPLIGGDPQTLAIPSPCNSWT